MGDPETPLPARHPTPAPMSVSADGLDRLLEILSDMQGSIKELSQRVSASQYSTEAARSLRAEHGELLRQLKRQGDQIEVLARGIKRHDSGLRQQSDADAALHSVDAALVIAIEETRKLAAKAADDAAAAAAGVAALATTTDAAATETRDQTPMLAKIENQTQQIALPAKLAAGVNVAVGVIYLILEAIRAWGH